MKKKFYIYDSKIFGDEMIELCDNNLNNNIIGTMHVFVVFINIIILVMMPNQMLELWLTYWIFTIMISIKIILKYLYRVWQKIYQKIKCR